MTKRTTVVSLIVVANLLVLIILILGLSAAATPTSLAADPITILTIDANASQAEQLATLLAAESGLEVHALIPGCPASSAGMLGLSKGDIAFLPALAYTESSDKYGSEVIHVAERYGYTSYSGQIMVHNDAGYSSINDLAGTNAAFPSQSSTSGYLLPIFHLSRTHGIDAHTFFNQLIDAGSHNDVVWAVNDKTYDGTPIQAGFAYADVRFALIWDLPDVFTDVQVLEQTVSLPNDTVSFRPNMDPALSSQLESAMSAVIASPEGAELISEIYGMQDLKPAVDADYNITRELATFWNLESTRCSEKSVITPQTGGSVTQIDGANREINLDVPAGATTETLQLSLTSLPAATHVPDNLHPAGPVIDITAVISDTTDLVTTLDAPFSLTADYDHGLDLPAEQTIAWYYWNGSAWTKGSAVTLDTDNNIVTVESEKLTQWAVFSGPPGNFLPVIIRP